MFAGFEEKTFESAYTSELTKVLDAPRPKGIALLPTLWPPGVERRPLPAQPVSFIVQFKRPEYLVGHSAAQWQMWRRPYCRFKVEAAQQLTLKRLEVMLGDDAIVRYASPTLHSLQTLEAAAIAARVIAMTGHVAPSELTGHKAWTYDAAGTIGRANPAGPRRRFERIEDMFIESDTTESTSSDAQIVRSQPLVAQVQRLGAVAQARNPSVRRLLGNWRRALRDNGVQPDAIDRAVNFGAMQSLVNRSGAQWWFVDRQSVI